ncbi:MAG: thioredoxin family protein [Pirellulales bacterium]
MTSVALAALLQFSALAVGGNNYAQAYREASESGRPMLLLITADWCPGCQVMKNSTLPQMARQGGLEDVNLVILNYDQNTALCRKMMRGNSIPQLVMYYKNDTGWRRRGLVGKQSIASVASMVKLGVDASIAARADKGPRVARAKDDTKDE